MGCAGSKNSKEKKEKKNSKTSSKNAPEKNPANASVNESSKSDDAINIDRNLLNSINVHQNDIINYITFDVYDSLTNEEAYSKSNENLKTSINDVTTKAILHIKQSKAKTYSSLKALLKEQCNVSKASNPTQSLICDTVVDKISKWVEFINENKQNKEFNLNDFLANNLKKQSPEDNEQKKAEELKQAAAEKKPDEDEEKDEPIDYTKLPIYNFADANTITRRVFINLGPDRAPTIRASSHGNHFILMKKVKKTKKNGQVIEKEVPMQHDEISSMLGNCASPKANVPTGAQILKINVPESENRNCEEIKIEISSSSSSEASKVESSVVESRQTLVNGVETHSEHCERKEIQIETSETAIEQTKIEESNETIVNETKQESRTTEITIEVCKNADDHRDNDSEVPVEIEKSSTLPQQAQVPSSNENSSTDLNDVRKIKINPANLLAATLAAAIANDNNNDDTDSNLNKEEGGLNEVLKQSLLDDRFYNNHEFKEAYPINEGEKLPAKESKDAKDDGLNDAATKIQSTFRGYKTRKELNAHANGSEN